MLRIALAFALMLTAQPTLALSCMPYSPEQAFWDAAASPDRYVVVHGRLDFNPQLLPQVDWTGQDQAPPDTEFAASFTGFSLTRNGFDARFVRSIRVRVQCFGPWCASLEPGRDYLAFLKKQGGGYLLETNPCGGFAFAAPTPEMIGRIETCFQGGPCDPPQF